MTADHNYLQRRIDRHFAGGLTPSENIPLVLEPGNFVIDEPLLIPRASGVSMRGAARHATRIHNAAGGSVFRTNGLSYSDISDMTLSSSGDTDAVFDIWSDGAFAIQSNTFSRLFMDGGGVHFHVHYDGSAQGSELSFRDVYCHEAAIAAYRFQGYNALTNLLNGGNINGCGIGVWVESGNVNIHSVGFQRQGSWDIRIDNSANDAMVISGCRSESLNFAKINNYAHHALIGCNHINDADGVFLSSMGPFSVNSCVSTKGNVTLHRAQDGFVQCSSFGRDDWFGAGHADAVISVVGVQKGQTPNGTGAGPAERITGEIINNQFVAAQ